MIMHYFRDAHLKIALFAHQTCCIIIIIIIIINRLIENIIRTREVVEKKGVLSINLT